VPWRDFAIVLRLDWEARESEESVVLFPRAQRELVEDGAPADAVLIQRVPGNPDDVDGVVFALMKRRVQQGEPECRVVSCVGVPALERTWLDGVSIHVSCFFSRNSNIYEVIRSEPAIRLGEDESGTARTLVASLSFAK
jgi:hypothetical protein